jgi:hypothetical protein
MKNLKLVLLFGGTLILLLIFQNVNAQEAIQSVTPNPGFFGKIGQWLQSQVVWSVVLFVAGIASKNGWTKIAKAILGRTTIVTRELSHVSLAVSNFSDLIDKAIENNGNVDQNSLKEAWGAGKTVVVEAKEAWVTIKPKV